MTSEVYFPTWLRLVLVLLLLITIVVLAIATKQKQKLKNALEKTNEEQKRTNEELSEKNKELEKFVRRVSHDLVAPIKSVRALVDIAKMEEDPGEQEKCLRMIQTSLDKQEEFIKRLLEQARNYKAVNKENIALRKIIENSVRELEYHEGAKDIDFRIEVPEDLIIYSDPDRIQIILSNLISNAIKYRRREEKHPFVEIRSKLLEPNQIEIVIEDNGEGIPEDALESIFEMFVRISEQSYGSGLGLHIVRQMVQKLGGSIEATATPGQGATFTITLKDISQE
jgi:signal transduction histidine kinase